MGLWDWFSQKAKNVKVAEDAIWMTETAKLDGLANAVQDELEILPLVIVAAHFPANLAHVKEAFDRRGLSSLEIPGPISANEAPQLAGRKRSPHLVVTLAVSLQASKFPPVIVSEVDRMAILVAERHFLRRHDERIVDFAKSLEWHSDLAFHLSLDDPLMRLFAGPEIAHLLRRLGMNESEAITSGMVSRRLNAAQARIAKQGANSDHKADSAEEWIHWNLPTLAK